MFEYAVYTFEYFWSFISLLVPKKLRGMFPVSFHAIRFICLAGWKEKAFEPGTELDGNGWNHWRGWWWQPKGSCLQASSPLQRGCGEPWFAGRCWAPDSVLPKTCEWCVVKFYPLFFKHNSYGSLMIGWLIKKHTLDDWSKMSWGQKDAGAEGPGQGFPGWAIGSSHAGFQGLWPIGVAALCTSPCWWNIPWKAWLHIEMPKRGSHSPQYILESQSYWLYYVFIYV